MRFLVMILLLTTAGYLRAEEGERFYQVVGPDGRIQTVKASPSSGKQKPVEQKAEKKEAVVVTEDKVSNDPATGAPSEKAVLKPAPYDGETYMDSDQLERSAFNPENRRKFFITSDGTRQRVEENLMPATADNTFEAPLATASAEAGRSHTELPAGIREVAPGSMDGFSGLCIKPEQAQPLAEDALRLYEDKRTAYFSRGQSLMAAYRIKGDGLRTVQLRSYSDSIKSPAFFSPFIGLADEKGCLVRVLDNYFHRSYGMTKTQYEMLEAEITLHGEERYLLVLRAIKPDVSLQPELAYAKSPFGQISLKFVK